jgi:hypothetical protein
VRRPKAQGWLGWATWTWLLRKWLTGSNNGCSVPLLLKLKTSCCLLLRRCNSKLLSFDVVRGC